MIKPGKRFLLVVALALGLGVLGLGSWSAWAQSKSAMAESARSLTAISQLLSNPKFEAAVRAAQADPKAAAAINRDPRGYLSKAGVEVPTGLDLKMDARIGSGKDSKISIEAGCYCFPSRSWLKVSW